MKEKILVVDDERDIRELIKNILLPRAYQVILAENGKEALEVFDKTAPDLIISDIRMPKMDGFEFLKTVRGRKGGAAVPFLFLSAYSQEANLVQARRLAVDDYLFKPFDAHELLDAVRVRLDRRKNVQLFDRREAHLQTILLMANTIEARDPYMYNHLHHVRKIALLFGKSLKWDEDSLSILELGSLLHDIGKFNVPLEILNKQGSFTAEERKILHQHPESGAEMLKGITHLKPTIPYILYHHEKWDGSGYPFGLSRESIPLEGRIMAIIDVYDAIGNDRSYHRGQTKEKALKTIKEKSGSHFDPLLVAEFLKLDLP